jgi:hypothetical protein
MSETIPFDQMALIAKGREAEYLDKQLQPFLEEIEKDLLAKMKIAFRSNVEDDTSLKVAVGILCALEDLRSQILRYANQGKSIERKVKDG